MSLTEQSHDCVSKTIGAGSLSYLTEACMRTKYFEMWIF